MMTRKSRMMTAIALNTSHAALRLIVKCPLKCSSKPHSCTMEYDLPACNSKNTKEAQVIATLVGLLPHRPVTLV